MFAAFVIKFVIFGFCGWLWESVLYTVLSGKFDNRGFLYGPLCPIYGLGANIAAALFGPFIGSPFKLFFVCMISSAILEYLTSFVLEKFFGARWWDYSTIPLNIHGRICLSCSIAFGLAGVILLPGAIIPIIGFVDSIPSEPATVIAIFLAGFLGGDTFLSINNITDLNKLMEDIEHEAIERKNAAGRYIEEHGGNAIKEAVMKRVPKLSPKQTYLIKNIYSFTSENKEKIIRILKISVGYPLESADTQTDEKDI
jgi:uncharacterized membrane protein